MNIEDRIENIKILLAFCPQSTEDVKIVDEKVGQFFANLFNNDERFTHTHYDRVYPRIYLSEDLNTDYKTYSTTIRIEYVYESDRDGWYTEAYDFNDKDLEDTCCTRDLPGLTRIEYDEVPDEIWEIIQNIVNKEATKNLEKELESAKQSVEYWENKIIQFNNRLNLNL